MSRVGKQGMVWHQEHDVSVWWQQLQKGTQEWLQEERHGLSNSAPTMRDTAAQVELQWEHAAILVPGFALPLYQDCCHSEELLCSVTPLGGSEKSGCVRVSDYWNLRIF